MKFRLTETILTEGKNLEKTWEKYREKLEKERRYTSVPAIDAFNLLVMELDPTYEAGTNTTGDYGEWIIRQYLLNNSIGYRRSSQLEIISALEDFIDKKANLKNKDINSYKTLEELKDALEEVELSPRQKERRLRNSKDIKIVYQNNDWIIYTPLSFAGSCTLGKGTEWCTAYSNDDWFYYEYKEDGGELYIIINKNDPSNKYQYSTRKGEFKDSADYDQSVEMVFRNSPDIVEFLTSKPIVGVSKLGKELAFAFNLSPYEAEEALDCDYIDNFPGIKTIDELGKYLEDNNEVEDFFCEDELVRDDNGDIDWETTISNDSRWAIGANGNSYFWENA